MLKDLQKYAEDHLHKDTEYAIFLANVGEIIYHYDKDPLCLELFEKSHSILEPLTHKLQPGLPNAFKPSSKSPKFMTPDFSRIKERRFKNLKQELSKVDKTKELKKPKFYEVFDFDNELHHELFAIDKMGFLENHQGTIYGQNLETLIKVELRFAQACSVIKQDFHKTLKILSHTERKIDNLVFPNPCYIYMVNFLKGYCHKMIFYEYLGQFQNKILELSRTKINKVYNDFAQALPPKGLATGQLFSQVPNFRKLVKEQWRKHLLQAEEFLKKAVEITKDH